MIYKVTNILGTEITLNDLSGKVIPFDAVDLDLLAAEEFAVEDLLSSMDLQTAIANGDLIAKEENGYLVKNLCPAASSALIGYMNVSGTIVLSAYGSSNNTHHVKVNGATTLDLTNLMNGPLVSIMIEQTTGGHAVTLPVFENLDVQPTIPTVAGKMTTILVMKMNNKYHLHALIKHDDVF